MRICVDRFRAMSTLRLSAVCHWCIPWHVVCAKETCLITQQDAWESFALVKASDGHVYDARALQTWLKKCAAEERALEVVPTMPISYVTPVQCYIPRLLRRISKRIYRKRATDILSRHVSTQTETEQILISPRNARHVSTQTETEPTLISSRNTTRRFSHSKSSEFRRYVRTSRPSGALVP